MNCTYTAWCSEIDVTDACNSGASSDHREPISLHQAVHAYMHISLSIERWAQFGSLTRWWIWIRVSRMAFSFSLEFEYVVLGLFFSLAQLSLI